MYELMIMVGSLAEKIDEEILSRTKGLIEDLGGKVKKENIWEQQRLAYPINKRSSAFYAVFEFELENEKIDELQKKLNLDEGIMRFLVINKTGIKEEKPRVPRIAKAKPIGKSLPTEEKGEKIKIEELDKKLEEILKE